VSVERGEILEQYSNAKNRPGGSVEAAGHKYFIPEREACVSIALANKRIL
jgi:hypothetical protein